jgi:hypothetical protein
LRKSQTEATLTAQTTPIVEPVLPEELKPHVQEPRKPRVNFWDKFKIKMIDMFSEEDQMLNK